MEMSHVFRTAATPDRRALLTTLLAAAAVSLLVGAIAQSASAATAVSRENALTGTTDWIRPYAPRWIIEGYVSATSVEPGQALEIHVSVVPSARYRVVVYRLGWYGGAGARQVACTPSCDGGRAGTRYAVPAGDPVTQEVVANWPVTDTLPVDQGWTSGYYLAELLLVGGPSAGSAYRIPFVVRSVLTSEPTAAVVVAPTNTWEAYNSWGGANFYLGSEHPAYKVSSQRPGTTDLTGPQWEIPLVRYLERGGYDVSYVADQDVDALPATLLRHRLVIIAGHSEYWTHDMRNAVVSAIAVGTNVAFMGANFAYWQVRYEDDRRTIVAYKAAAALDPVSDPLLRTIQFRYLDPLTRDCALAGAEYEPGAWGAPLSGLTVAASSLSDSWFHGTGITADSTFAGTVGGTSNALQGEWDQVDTTCVPGRVTVFFHLDGPDGKPNADTTRWIAPSGAVVFAAGTHGFSWGLDDSPYSPGAFANAGLQVFMANALTDLLRPSAPKISIRRDTRAIRVFATSPDPRVQHIIVFLHRGASQFPVTAATRPACISAIAGCDVKIATRGVYRLAAVAADAWGNSQPEFSAPVRFSGPRRRVSH